VRALFDSGNQRLHFGLWDGRLSLVEHYPYPDTPEELIRLLRTIAGAHRFSGAAAASVSSKWREPLFRAIRAAIPGELRVARTAADVGIAVPYRYPETYGVDRALGVFAAYRWVKSSCVVIDAGTALTVDAVDDDGSVAGGFIMPGFAAQARALAATADLPFVIPAEDGVQELSFREDEPLTGQSTEECIRLGILYGFRASAEQLARLAGQAVHAGDRIILTGGEAALLTGSWFERAERSPGLVLEGLGLAADTLPVFTM
jgi:type III pantothenate kinase